MLFLAEFTPITPSLGLIFWTTIIFGLFWLVMGKLAFKPIANSLKERNGDITDALQSADRAREEMANLKAKNEELLIEAREERAKMLREAKDMQDEIIADAKIRAQNEYTKKVESALQEINNRKMEMLIDVKNQSGLMALDIAEKVIKKELKGNPEHENYVSELLKEIKIG